MLHEEIPKVIECEPVKRIVIGPLSDHKYKEDHILELWLMFSVEATTFDDQIGEDHATFFIYKIPETGEVIYAKYEYPEKESIS